MFGFAISLFAATVAPAAPTDPCDGVSTVEMNECLAKKLETSERRLEKYQQAAIERYSADDYPDGAAIALGIKASSAAFEAYKTTECATVLEDNKGGTIRTVMVLGCQIELVDQRTHTIWSHWLQYMDSTPPILPEPKPTE